MISMKKNIKGDKKVPGIIPVGFVIFLFVLLPLLYNKNLYDPELSIRFIGLSVLIALLSVYFFIKKQSAYFSASKEFFQQNEIQLFFILFIFISGISIFRGYDFGAAFYDWLRFLLLFLFLIQVIYLLKQFPELCKQINTGVAVAVLIFTFFGVIDFYPSVLNALKGAKLFQVEYYFGSTLGNKNFYAETLFLCLPFLLDGFLQFTNWKKHLMISSIIIVLASILILQSVSVFIAFTISLVIFIIIYLEQIHSNENQKNIFSKRQIIFYSCIGVILFTLSAWIFFHYGSFEMLKSKFTSFYHYLKTDKTQQKSKLIYGSFTERFILWKQTFKMIADHPFFGCGISNWKILYPKYGITGIDFMDSGLLKPEHPHNDYLLVFAEQGVFGLIIYLLIFILIIKKAFQNIKSAISSKNKIRNLFMFCGICGFMILSLFGFPMQRFYQMIFLMLFFVFTIINETDKEETIIKKNSVRYSKIFFTVTLLISIYSCWFFIKRYYGEIHFRRALHEQLNKNWSGMQYEISLAKSFPFQSDLLATPLEWYAGFADFYSGNIQSAQNQYKNASVINPFHIQTWNDLATCYEQNKNYLEAIRCYKKALEINPTFYNSILNLTAAYFNSGNIDSAYQTIYSIPFREGNRQYKNFLIVVLKARLTQLIVQQANEIQRGKILTRLNDKKYLFKLFYQAQSSGKEIDTLFLRQSKKLITFRTIK